MGHRTDDSLFQYIVRRAYYSAANQTSNPEEHGHREDFDLGIDRHPHVGHCFDYLRQSLEPNKERVVGNPNWGFERQCRDFESLKTWAEQWAAVDLPGGFIPAVLSGHHHG